MVSCAVFFKGKKILFKKLCSKNFGQTILLSRRFCLIKFWSKQFLAKKICSKITFIQKKFWSKKKFRDQWSALLIFLRAKKFCSKNFGPTILLLQSSINHFVISQLRKLYPTRKPSTHLNLT